jgi:hypothetical protein
VPEIVFCVLMALLEYDTASMRDMSLATGYDVGKYSVVVRRMTELGWLVKPWNGGWRITERGKIGLAIEVGRRARKMRSGGRRQRAIAVRKFLVMENVISCSYNDGSDHVSGTCAGEAS